MSEHLRRLPTGERGAPEGPPARRRARSLAAVAPMLASVLLAACGGGSSKPAADPAGVVPATAPLYVGAEVRPGGALAEDAKSLGQAIAGKPDPYSRLVAALQTPGSPPLDYERDVAPWLGPRAGAFVRSTAGAGPVVSVLEGSLLGTGGSSGPLFGPSGADGAVVLDTSDEGRARSFLEGQAARAGAPAGSYRGVAWHAGSGVAFALVHGFAVVGSEQAVREVIDTASGGSPLSSASGYSKLLGAAPAGVLAHLYAAASPANPAGARSGASGLMGLLTGGREANVSLVPAKASATIDVDTPSSGATGRGGLISASAEGARAQGELPGESWLAIGLGDLRTSLDTDVAQLHELVSLLTGGSHSQSGGITIEGLLSGLLAPLQALAAEPPQSRSWMGAGGVFAGGPSLLELKAGVEIESHNPAASRAAVARLAGELQRKGAAAHPVSVPGTEAAQSVSVSGLPLELVIASGRDAEGGTRFVIGLGEASVTAALTPASTFASSSGHSTAASALGEGIEPNLYFELPTLLGLLEGAGLTQESSISSTLPYLKGLGAISGGGRSLGDGLERYKLVAQLQKQG